eukprot:770282-Pleurochrysis_carterae.AAC.2
MAEPAGERAGAMLYPLTIPLSQGRRESEERTDESGGRRQRLDTSPRCWGVASGPPTRPSKRLWSACVLGFAEKTHSTEPRGEE